MHHVIARRKHCKQSDTTTRSPTMSPQTSHRNDRFATTRWSMVVQLADKESPVAREALEKLTQRYWYPAYAYVRRCGHAPSIAAEMTQNLLQQLHSDLSRDVAREPPGHFRRFLLDRIHDFLAGDWRELLVEQSADRELIAPPDLEARFQLDRHGAHSP